MSDFKDWPEEACLAPLTSYLVGTSGKYRPCCWFTEKLDPNHARAAEQKLTLQEYREQILFPMYEEMKKGKYPDACKRCALPGFKRSQNYERFRPDVGQIEKTKEVRYIDLRFSNLCNLGCVMCNTGSSNQFNKQADQGKYMPESVYWMGPKTRRSKHYTWTNNKKVMTELYKHLETATHIYLTGGEPSINPDVIKMMEYCRDKGFNKRIKLEFNTNCTNANDKFVDLLHSFTTQLMFSIDAVGELGEAIRYPSKWDYVQKAVWEMISRGGPRAKFTWAPSIHVYNFFKLHELVAYFKKIEKQWLDKDINTNWNVIFQPYYQNVNNIPKDLFEEYIHKHRAELGSSLITKLSQKKHGLANENIDWEKTLEIGRKWFTSRGYDPKLTGIPGI